MRIVGGRFRGRVLAALGKGDAGAHLRPTSDRVRESLFNVIEHGHRSLEGARVLDLFAGTGALGFEALSRGAAEVVFVEQGRIAQGLIAKNAALLGVKARVIRRDATRPGRCEGAPYDLVFADPPYGKGMGGRALEAALAGGWIAPGALVVLEEGGEVALPEGFTLHEVRRYGDTVLHLASA